MSYHCLLNTMVADENWFFIWLRIFVCDKFFLSSCIQDSFSLWFSSLITIPWWDLFEFILSGVYWASWMCGFMLFIKFGKFLAIIYSIVLCLFLYLTFGISIMRMVQLVVFHGFLRSLSFFSAFPSSFSSVSFSSFPFYSSDWIISWLVFKFIDCFLFLLKFASEIFIWVFYSLKSFPFCPFSLSLFIGRNHFANLLTKLLANVKWLKLKFSFQS